MGAVAAFAASRFLRAQPAPVARSAQAAPVPVEVGDIIRGPIENRRVFSGSLAAAARVGIAPKIDGRILTLSIDISDPVTRGQVIATLDRDEYEQDVAQAEADLAVAEAGLAEAKSAADIAEREFERVASLHTDKIVSDADLDVASAERIARTAAVAVAKARVMRAESALRSARIRMDYTTVRAEWDSGDERRVVAERHAEEGDTVSAGAPIVTIVELDPIEAIIFATEADYAQLQPGQAVSLATDAHPGRRWEGAVARVAPVFEEGSRQARVEIRVANPDFALKPGMFVRVEAILGRVDDAVIVPVNALTQRDGKTVVFLVCCESAAVKLVPVEPGIRDGDRVQVVGAGLEGRVVTLGQQLLGDGAAITIPADERRRAQASP